MVSEAVPAPSPAETPDDSEQSTPEAVSPDEASSDSNTEQVTVAPTDHEASSDEDGPADAIGEAVSWSAPEVLANDVAWDDDDIELVDYLGRIPASSVTTRMVSTKSSLTRAPRMT